MNRSVQYLIPSENVPMGGVLVGQALPTQKVSQVDPFLLLHHAKFKFHDKAPALHQGLGPHPHRGFTPVTFVIDGEVHHRDSRGHSQVAKAGEVQWMHAGAGIIHSERPSEALAQRNGSHEIIQLWINSPATAKMNIPKYQYLPEDDMSIDESEDGLIKTKLVAGTYKDELGKIETESELLVLWSHAEQGGQQTFAIPDQMNAVVYVISGEVRLHNYGAISKKHLAVLYNDGDVITIDANESSQFLILAGEPHEEKVVQQGPFVMNTETQILEAIRDYQMGKMGVLIEEK